MPSQVVYIYYDTVGNNVLSKGIVNINQKSLLKRTPNNLLLIKGDGSVGDYDNHSGFQVIKGQENVRAFLENSHSAVARTTSWIDFTNLEMLHQLTPVEISEILYLAHAHNYLHSPFYYKLQNNYIFLSLPNGFNKVYYRYLEEFIDQFVGSITQRMTNKLNEKKRFFQKDRIAAPFAIPNMDQLALVFREGVCLSFRQIIIKDDLYRVPIFIAEDKLSLVDRLFDEDEAVGYIEYHAEKGEWTLIYDFD